MSPDKLQETQQYIDFVKNNLAPLAEHLKVSVEWLWQILVNQVRVEAIVYLVIIVMLSIKSAVLLTVAFKSFKKARFGANTYNPEPAYIHKKTGEQADWSAWYDHKKDYDVVRLENKTNLHGHLVYWCGIGGVTLGLVTTIIAATVMPKIVTGLVNPEYGAIERIVQFSQGKIPSSNGQ
jgi:hypothetical protein